MTMDKWTRRTLHFASSGRHWDCGRQDRSALDALPPGRRRSGRSGTGLRRTYLARLSCRCWTTQRDSSTRNSRVRTVAGSVAAVGPVVQWYSFETGYRPPRPEKLTTRLETEQWRALLFRGANDGRPWRVAARSPCGLVGVFFPMLASSQ